MRSTDRLRPQIAKPGQTYVDDPIHAKLKTSLCTPLVVCMEALFGHVTYIPPSKAQSKGVRNATGARARHVKQDMAANTGQIIRHLYPIQDGQVIGHKRVQLQWVKPGPNGEPVPDRRGSR